MELAFAKDIGQHLINSAKALGGTGGGGSQEDDLLYARMSDSDLIINTSVHSPTGSYLSSIGAEAETPVLHAHGTWLCRPDLLGAGLRAGGCGCGCCAGRSAVPGRRRRISAP
jgi:hypothetical protein